jgi:putative phosphoesterase
LKRVGVISDTHGLLRPEAVAALQGCDRIVHAGDVGNAEVLAKLSAIAPVTAVRGNNDVGGWAERLRETEILEIGGASICAIHELSLLDKDPAALGVQVVIYGHSHKPSVELRDGVLYLNPGSAGPRRFRLPVTLAELKVAGGKVSAKIIELRIGARPSPLP